MKRQTQIIAILLEVFALVLANLQGMMGGVLTDEAKYLLSIPYPHPPFLRGIMAFTELLPFQEWLWRALISTLLVQAVWLVWDMAKRMPTPDRFAIAATWLFSAALVLQAGQIYMAPVTALQALIFVWLFFRSGTSVPSSTYQVPKFFKRIWHMARGTWNFFRGTNDISRAEWSAFWVAMLWFASLFTAYQILLFIPLVLAVFAGLPVSRAKKILYFIGPLLALVVYTVGSPLIIASFAIHGAKDAAEPLITKIVSAGWLWILGGSMFGSIAGAWGILRSRSWALVLSFFLVSLSVFLAWQPYYAILFTPLLLCGLMHFFHYRPLHTFPYTPLLVFSTAVLVGIAPPWFGSVPSRAVVTLVEREATQSGSLMIYGSFGHDWQYESSKHVVRRYTPEGFKEASALACTVNCDAIRKEGMSLATRFPVEVWLRHKK